MNVKPGEGLIDDIIQELQLRFGDFKVRNAHIFDVTKPTLYTMMMILNSSIQRICRNYT